MPSIDFYPVLAPAYVLRRLETPFAYNTREDELYELDEEAFIFLRKCDGKTPFSKIIAGFGEECRNAIEYMMNEGIILMQETAAQRKIREEQSPIPSLRYLLLSITHKCNLSCKHCYLGNPQNRDMEPRVFEKSVSQFEEMGGLKLMISGGEPLMHNRFWELMEVLRSYELRIVILSNGTLIDRAVAGRLSEFVDEVQVSIDGIRSHDLLRGKGSYNKAMSGISALAASGIPIAIATMLHRYNAAEFEEMQALFSDLKVLSWSVDMPCAVGNLKKNMDFILPLEEASLLLKYGYGAGAHESTGNFTCGSHLCAVSPEGDVSKCGFFEDEPAGDVEDLRAAWSNLCKNYLWTIDKLECRDCRVVEDCRGGCRFRAKQFRGMLAPDPLLCHEYGVLTYL